MRKALLPIVLWPLAATALAQATSEWRTSHDLPVAVVEVAGGDVEVMAAALPAGASPPVVVAGFPATTTGQAGMVLWATRVPLEHLGTRVYPDMFSLAQAHTAFDAHGQIADRKLRDWFDSTIGCFVDLVEAAKHYGALKTEWIEFLGEHPDAATERVEA